MTTAVQRRRGTNTEHASFTGLEGEISVNTTNESVHVHDGSTAGGFELMRADGANSTVTLGDISGVTAGTGLSGGGTTGTVTLGIDGTVATLAGTQTFTNKTLTSPILNTPTIGTSFTIGGATITETELEILDGATVTTTELNYVDGVTSSIQTQIDAKAPLASPSFTGNVSVGGTVDGRDLAADGTKLDGIEASADVTDTTNVTAAGALMDSELTSEASVKALDQGVATTDSPAFAGLTVDTTTLAVDSTNNRVGIGTASPSAKLDSQETYDTVTNILTNGTYAANFGGETGTGAAGRSQGIMISGRSGTSRGAAILAENQNSGNAHDLLFATSSTAAAPAERMRIDSSGQVGIGTTSPTRELEVTGSGNVYIKATAVGANDSAGLELDNAGVVWLIQNDDTSSDALTFDRAGVEAMRIDSSGNVGIGTTTVGQFASIDLGLTVDSGNVYSGIAMTDGATTSTLAQGYSTTYLYNQANGAMLFGTANTERMRLDGSGNIGLRATSNVVSSTSGSGAWVSTGNYVAIAREGTSSAHPALYLNQTGVNGQVLQFRKDGTSVGSISTNGSSLPSDRNFKRNIEPLDLGLDFVASLNPVTYNYKLDEEGQPVMTGLIAQEVEESLTAAGVEKNSMTLLQHTPTDDVKESDYQMDYLKLVPILINSIKEQQTLIESLTDRIAALEA